MLLHFDGTLIVIAISFIIFAILMHHIFYKPMRRVIEERSEYLSLHHSEAKKLNVKAQEVIDKYNQKIGRARLKGKDAIEKNTNKGKEEKSKLITDASSKAHDDINSARVALQTEKDNAVEVLKNDVAPLAQQIVSKILGTEVAISGIDQEKVDKILRG